MDVEIERLSREIMEQESRVRNARRASNAAQDNLYVAESRLTELKRQLDRVKLSEAPGDPRQLLNG